MTQNQNRTSSRNRLAGKTASKSTRPNTSKYGSKFGSKSTSKSVGRAKPQAKLPAKPEKKAKSTHGFAKELSSSQRARLKAHAHSLKPVVQIGSSGLTQTVAQEIVSAITLHELIKVQLPGDTAAAEKDEQTKAFANFLPPHAHIVSRLGRNVLLYLEKDPSEQPKYLLATL